MFTNYKYYTDNASIVVAVSTYAGKKVRGVAKCSSEDKFDLEKGKQLAATKCNLKIAEKRKKRANKKYHIIMNKLIKMNKEFADVYDYYKNANQALKEAKTELEKLISTY